MLCYFTVIKKKTTKKTKVRATERVHVSYCWIDTSLHPSALYLFLYVFKCMLIISIHGKPGVWFFFAVQQFTLLLNIFIFK